jgi:PRC-barrel domain
MFKRTITATALATMLAVPAFAQQPPANPGTAGQSSAQQNPGFMQNQDPTQWRGTKLIGTSVYGPDNSSIGEISDVIIGSDGTIKAVVIGVGGFLGVAQKDVAVPFNALNVTRTPSSSTINKITVTYTKDQLKNAPQFAYYEPGGSATTGSGASTGTTGGTTSPMNR